MRTRAKSTAAVGAMGVAAVILAASPASATSLEWTRSCGTTYGARVNDSYASTVKEAGGSCAGYVYLRIKLNGTWSSWRVEPSFVRIDKTGIEASQHKGCSDCDVKTLFP